MNVNNDAMGNRISKTVINKNMATDKEKSVATLPPMVRLQ